MYIQYCSVFFLRRGPVYDMISPIEFCECDTWFPRSGGGVGWGRVTAPHIHRVCRVGVKLFITELTILTTGLPPFFSF
jgi:hypothetical protein